MEDGDQLEDGAKVTLTTDYAATLQGWVDHQPQPRPQWAPKAPALSWAGQVGKVLKSHRSSFIGLTFYNVAFPEMEHLDAWYLRSELEREGAKA